jgi:tRNA(Arg) A34 adenosine deaminase TadA
VGISTRLGGIMLPIGIVNLAIKEAEASTYRYKVGAVLFNKQCIVASGRNGVRSNPIHPKYKTYKESFHAEQSCLTGLNWNLLGRCQMLIIRVNPSGNFGLAKPCEMCLKLLQYVRIKTIYYSTADGIVKEKI